MTPGPWTVREIGYGAHVSDVAWVGFGSRCSKEEHMANARLMAAAPELFAALLKLEYNLIREFTQSVYDENFAYVSEALRAAKLPR